MANERKTATELGFKVGDKFKVIDAGQAGTEASWAEGKIFILNRDDDTRCPYFRIEGSTNEYCLYFAGLERIAAMDNLRPGDTIVNSFGEMCRVLAATGELVALSNNNEFDSFDNWYLSSTLSDCGWNVRLEESEEVKELTVADVEKLVGSKVKIVKE